MTSSLAKQLSALANPEFTFGTGEGRLEGKLRPSFLFDPKVAATYDLDTMFSIGSNGFAELVQIDKRFRQFEQPLFSDAAKETDRVLRDAAFNKSLDAVLHSALLALSPHFLLKPAGKVLEWLIRRFRINEFNVESVIACILPYYESKQFTAMLTTLDLSASPKLARWAFLARVVETAKPMDRLFFLRRLFTDRSLVDFVCSTVQDRVRAKHPFSTAFTFYTTTLVCYVTQINEVTADTATLLMPFILHGIASTNKDWRFSNYLVLCQLAARTSLAARVLNELVATIVKHAQSETPQAILTLVCLSQSQPNFPQDCEPLTHVMALPGALATLDLATAKYRCGPFLHALVRSLVASRKWADLHDLLTHASIRMPSDTIVFLVRAVLEVSVGSSADAEAAAPILRQLQGRYSAELDATVAAHVAAAGDDADRRTAVFRVVKQCLGSTVHALIEDLGTTLFLALQHPSDAYCLAAVQHLAAQLADAELDASNVLAEDAAVLATSVVDAFDRKHRDIIPAVLASPALVAFVGTHAGPALARAVVAHALTHPSVEAVRAVDSLLRAGTLDAAATRDATLYLRHVQAAHADWFAAEVQYALEPVTPSVATIAALLAQQAYATSGLSWVSPANIDAVMDPVLALIAPASSADVRDRALSLALANKRHGAAQRTFVQVLALPDAMFAAALPRVDRMLTGATALAYLCPALRATTPTVVVRALGYIRKFMHVASPGTDFQVLLPHVVPCLLSEDCGVREAVVEVLRELVAAYAAAPFMAKKAGKKIVTVSPIGYSGAKDIVYVEPKLLKEFFEAALAKDLAASAEAVQHLGYRRRFEAVLTAFLSHLPYLDLGTTSAWFKVLQRVDSKHVFLNLHMHFRARHDQLVNAEKQAAGKKPAPQLYTAADSPLVDVIVQFIHSITPLVAAKVMVSESFETVKQFLNGYATPALARVQQATLTRITPKLWESLSPEQHHDVLYVLLNIVSKSPISDVVLEAKAVLKRIPVAVETLVDMFMFLITTKAAADTNKAVAGSGEAADTGNAAKRVNTGEPAMHRRLGKLTSLLELVSYKEVEDSHLLVAPLFTTLEVISNHPAQGKFDQYDYIVQLILADLLHVSKAGLDESAFRINVLVSCIRSTDNPQTHNSLFMVLSSLAPLCSEKVLLNVMPIFTFMGAKVLRQDDEYTFNVVETTIEKIIPALLLSAQNTKTLLQTFTDAYSHIPGHRRLRLYTTLVRTLGEEYLYALLALLLAQEHVKMLEFCLLLSAEFGVAAQLGAMIQLTRMCVDADIRPAARGDAAAAAKPAVAAVPAKEKFPNRRKKSPRAAALAAAAAALMEEDDRIIPLSALDKIRPPVLMFIDENLLMRSFINGLSKSQVEGEVKQFIEALLILVQHQADNKPVLRLAYGVLDKVHHLLSLNTFLAVAADLWKHPNALVQKRAVAMFNDRVGHLSAATVAKYRATLLATLPAVLWIFSPDAKLHHDAEMTQLGLMAIQQLCVHFAAQPAHTQAFMDCMPVVLAQVTNGSAPAVTASALVCLSHMVAQMKQRTVKHLNAWMPALLDFFAQKQQHVLNRLSALACLEQCVRHLHAFLSPYLGRIYASVFAMRAAKVAVVNPQVELLHAKLDEVAALIAAHVAPRHVLPALYTAVDALPATGAAPETEPLVQFATHVVAALPKDGVKAFSGDIFHRVFLALLDHAPYSASVLPAVVALVMKLNEDLFRPLFAHLLRWVREKPAPRRAAFFHVLEAMFDAIKNLLVGYAALAFEDAIATIAAAVDAPDAKGTIDAATHAIGALHKCALYDTVAAVAGQLEPLAASLVSALRVPALAPAASAALVQIAVTVNGDEAWKVLHSAVLGATRVDLTDEFGVDDETALAWRKAAIATVGQLFETIGEGYLTLLPETIPAVAECLEDEACEKVTAAAVRQIEGVLGEPLAKYLQK
ncbi:snoRNA-binding rRNA-processing protein utp10 [Blastocladiella emersonii ATCC 22665]|nr:snoRNA-binding rRNA-processing protein utp10 [Blastocladiella emersonii ATCC 22665]